MTKKSNAGKTLLQCSHDVQKPCTPASVKYIRWSDRITDKLQQELHEVSWIIFWRQFAGRKNGLTKLRKPDKSRHVIDKLFYNYCKELERNGNITHIGTIIDTTFVDLSQWRNTCEESK